MASAALTPPQTAYDSLPGISAKEALANMLHAPPSPPQSKRADSAVASAGSEGVKLERLVDGNAEYEAQWSAYLGLEDEWGYVLKDDREDKRHGAGTNLEEEQEGRVEDMCEGEWSAYLGLDYSGEW